MEKPNQTLSRDERIISELFPNEIYWAESGRLFYQTLEADLWAWTSDGRDEIENALFRAGGSYRMSLEFNAGEVLCQIQFLRFTQSGLAHMGCADNKADAFLNAAEEAVKHLKAENLL